MRLVDADALDVVGTVIPSDIDTKSYVMGMEYILNKIDSMPTIEERKTGEWIDITNDESLEEEYECSVCGYELFYSYPTKFCPNCGADMRGGNHETP